MNQKLIHNCPSCQCDMNISQLECGECHVKITGDFKLNPLLKLSQEDQDFALIFIRKRGNIKAIEEELGISYPTVRNKLNQLIKALGFNNETEEDPSVSDILNDLKTGKIDVKNALDLINKK
ncbi:MAG TPA: DUF2089 domain-containing protein [Bdellovibrionota bacterium]|nr:DUF2089 domain-containing protein [Bdellovibrionota bacterium]